MRQVQYRWRIGFIVQALSLFLGGVALRSQVSLPNRAPAGYPMPAANTFFAGGGARPTHRFWAAKNWFDLNLTNNNVPYTMFAEPLAFQATRSGLEGGYSNVLAVQPKYFLHPVQFDFVLGTTGLQASQARVTEASDWETEMDFGSIRTRVGRGMPFVYATTSGEDPRVAFLSTPEVFKRAGNSLGVRVGANSYGLFCPSGGTWQIEGRDFTCHLPAGKRYFSLALLPSPSALALFARYAFSFPEETRVRWRYDETDGRVESWYTVTTQALEGEERGFLQALYPHQYASLADGVTSAGLSYVSSRGPMKLYSGASFRTVDIFHGILPFLPLTQLPSEIQTLRQLVAAESSKQDHGVATDTYATGKSLLRSAELMTLARMVGDRSSAEAYSLKATTEMRRWFVPNPGRQPPTFIYDPAWDTVIGYPAAYGSAEQLNDHHFHYGYWIHAASLVGLYDPVWLRSATGGQPLRWLVRDIATIDRGDAQFPFLRNFDAYAGHSWASGQAPFADGENEESSSEAINAWAGLILYSEELGDKPLRDAAIWMYTLETNAANDYWFDNGPVRTFPPGFNRVQIANLFDGKADTATWFGDQPGFEHGIEFLPFTGASLYLGRDESYCSRNLAEVTAASHGQIDTASSDWPDLMEMYEALFDPATALREWKNTGYTFDGETRAHEFAWISSLAMLGGVDQTVTANYPIYAVFRTKGGKRSHVAFNLSAVPRRIEFSDGFSILLPASSFSVNGEISRIVR